MRGLMIALLALAVSGLAGVSQGQPAAAPYNPLETFAPLDMPTPVNIYRSPNGAPGPGYWQNRVDYRITASLDPGSKTLSGDEVITYTNNSPDLLDVLWLQLDQNTYRRDSRAGAVGGRPRTQFTDGDVLDAVEVGTEGRFATAAYVVSDTRLQIRLPAPLRGHGGRVEVHIRWHYTVPGVFGGRTAWVATKNGDLYDIAQWFPRLAVYDDVRGWDTLPYLGSEFYLEYGTIDYAVTLPADMVVAGSGELANPNEVLTPSELSRLSQARASDRTVMIRTPEEAAAAGAAAPASATKTWRFHMENTRDVAFAASKAFVWDAARINLPDNKTSLAMSVYPPESVGPNQWDKSTEYVKDTIERFSKHWFPYPWPTAVSVAGFSTGMEYPGVVFDGIDDKDAFLFWVTAHEIGHDWFPMIVGSNERRHAFMDEGFNTFIDIQESVDYAGGKYAPKRDSEYSAGGEPPDTILKVLDNPDAPTVMALADAYPFQLGHPVSYFKGAYGMVLLREQILGPERFDWAFRKYIRDWAYKHPSPSDFFRAMESEGGEDLSWFWRGWYLENWKYDVAVDKIDGSTVTLSNRGQLVLPTTVEVTFKDGSKERQKLPVETWLSKGTYAWTLDNKSPIASVTVDPDHVLPDDDRTNNSKTANSKTVE